MNPKLQSILNTLKDRLAQLYGADFSSIVLYGSQVRGEAQEDSDVDVLLVLKREPDPNRETGRVVDITAPLSLEHDIVISCVCVPERRFLSEDTPFLRNVRREGYVL